ncbi:MAG TPA: 7-carboxy-7-deazaguanine synthase QueE [Gemmatales bacterium]|nr:7-carboxy-7-deazaguanine synthase QueE [Gemmatales bacterium]HMP18573.1 7-carboxy-7-deazaguanine synthase QueE [Gemmatales bacterium]
MHIAEIFYSIQGEGMLTGMPSIFVRTSGCNLRCSFCDTPYTSWNPEGTHFSLQTILDKISVWNCSHVVVTGGEPLIAPQILELCQELRKQKKHITIETAATVYKPVAADLMSLSPKLSNSTPAASTGWAERHQASRIQLEVIQQYLANYECQFKFVMDQPDDIEEIRSLLSNFPCFSADRIFLMPQAIDASTLASKGRWIADLCKQYGFRLGTRIHIDLWGHSRGT